MRRFYIPYQDDRPALINIKGHKVLILSTDEESLTNSERLEVEEVKSLEASFNTDAILDLETSEEDLETTGLNQLNIEHLSVEQNQVDMGDLIEKLPKELLLSAKDEKLLDAPTKKNSLSEHICVVIANQDMDIDSLIRNVEYELPWVH